MKRILTCIVCPLGCTLEVELEDKKVLSVTGNNCSRGASYAETECISPMRTVTSTVRCEDGSLVAVKTDRAIPKESVFECMKIINRTVVKPPIAIGDVLLEDVFGARLVAAQNKKA